MTRVSLRRAKTSTKAFALLGLMSGAWLNPISAGAAATFSEDKGYEQLLHFQADPDKTITPARVLRWMHALRTHTEIQPAKSNTEFAPILDVHDSRVNFVAAIKYKF